MYILLLLAPVCSSMRTLLVILALSIPLLSQVRGSPGKHFLIETDDEAADDLGVTDAAAEYVSANDKAVADTESATDYRCPHCDFGWMP